MDKNNHEMYARIAEIFSGSQEDVMGIISRPLDEPAISSRSKTVPSETVGVSTTARLEAIWCKLLGLPVVSLSQDFFELGGDSLMATQMLSRVRDAFRIELPLSAIFSGSLTVEGLARVIEDAQISLASPEELESAARQIDSLPK